MVIFEGPDDGVAFGHHPLHPVGEIDIYSERAQKQDKGDHGRGNGLAGIAGQEAYHPADADKKRTCMDINDTSKTGAKGTIKNRMSKSARDHLMLSSSWTALKASPSSFSFFLTPPALGLKDPGLFSAVLTYNRTTKLLHSHLW